MTFLLDKIDCKPTIPSNKYIYNGNPVPRVTEILSSMLHEEYLLKWSNYLGFKRKNYKSVVEESANIGTYAHESIELYLKEGKINDIPLRYKFQVENALNSFIEWYNIVSSNNTTTLLSMEQELICQWFGGTADLLIKINDKNYLVDFKTSNHISNKYFIQLSSYKYMFELSGLNIDGLIVLQLDKNEVKFTEYILHMSIPEHKIFIDNCLQTFFGLVYAYYNRLNVEQQFIEIFK